MTKDEMIWEIAHENHYPQLTVDRVVNEVLQKTTECLMRGERVQFYGFGTFEMQERAPRKARNPRTGEEISVPSKAVPVFKIGNTLKNLAVRTVK